MSHPNTSIDSVIQAFFEQFVDSWGCGSNSPFENNQGAVFTVQLDHEHFGYEDDGNTHHPEWEGRCIKFAHIIITAGKNVFYACEKDKDERSIMNWEQIPVDKWINTSNHSSCWRSDGFRELVKDDFKAYEEAHKNVPEDIKPCYDNSHKYNRLAIGLGIHKLVNFVEVEHDAVDHSNSYHRKVVSLKKLKAKLTLFEED